MKFSVIIPVHNGEKYLNECLDSVLAQKGDFETELVVIENGSTDGSAAICDDYAARHSEVKVFRQEALGAYEGRRRGMRQATGDYLVFLDCDDALKEGALETLAGAVSGDDPDVVLYNAENMGSEGTLKFSFPFTDGTLYLGDRKREFYDVMCAGDSLNAMWNKSLKKSLADRLISEDDPDTPGMFNHGEDLTQTAQILDEARSILFINKALISYRKDNSGGLTTGYYPAYIEQQEYAWKKLLGYSKKWQKRDNEYDKVIGKRMALTCTITVSKLLKSALPWKSVRSELDTLIRKPFYRKYAGGELPMWAPQEASLVHDLQMSDDPYKALLAYSKKLRIKRGIKKLLGRK
ncbi:glycosyltransferase family 2 protein [Butyrivibrio sp. XPD2006]|uniref:glycosyltransferase family 2 protein n=1 Tax=Butyrivibrio sp. XPD2006 TaxID=1280668 RepID=UPI0003B678DC|nr:glycosyltransferase family 2 protein [Butyrivibrio sp. XPD2006]